MQTYNGNVFTVTVNNPVRTWTQLARRDPSRIAFALRKLSHGDWGSLDPTPHERNETIVRDQSFGEMVMGIYEDIVVIGELRPQQLPKTKLAILNPRVMTVEEAAGDPEVRKLLLKPVEELVS